ncbi:PucR family transcriptional regulator [Actinocrispum wychmicini]|uniref:Purine catabolism regulator n=1 Tax=Actinocrispum wychmicini TaxID=1213861 RepID=A0A4R2K816_9PSEU|nr:PucR family transcriptional regulator [Actinocrispum wychmicini]TCO62505.1 purine catabolism regulator [Actinocrispum wychmicini]
MITLAAIVRQRAFHLRVLAGAGALDRPVDWVHVSELADPTPFLRAGTLLLTTGLQLRDPGEYVARLAEAGVAGIGFGVGLSHRTVPGDLVDACAALDVPLVEVPFDTRFADLVRFVADDMARTAVRAARSTVDAERALIKALAAADPVASVTARLAKWLGGWAMVLDQDAGLVAVAPAKARKELRDVRAELDRIEQTGRFSVSWARDGVQISAHPIEGGYLAVGTPNLGPDGPGVIAIAVLLLSLQAEQARALRAAAVRLLVNGFVDDAAKIVTLPEPPVRVAILQDVDARGLLSVPDEDGLLCVIEADVQLDLGECGRAAVSDPVRLADLPKAVDQARGLVGALTGPGIVNAHDGLLSYVDTPAVRGYVRALLAPLRESPMLLETLRTFLECDGGWAEAATRLGIHRHTLKYRIQKIEDILGRRVADTGARAELWLALQLDN